MPHLKPVVHLLIRKFQNNMLEILEDLVQIEAENILVKTINKYLIGTMVLCCYEFWNYLNHLPTNS